MEKLTAAARALHKYTELSKKQPYTLEAIRHLVDAHGTNWKDELTRNSERLKRLETSRQEWKRKATQFHADLLRSQMMCDKHSSDVQSLRHAAAKIQENENAGRYWSSGNDRSSTRGLTCPLIPHAHVSLTAS
jgi:DNA repair exonuclease SbcCD ATPase subunit